MSYASIFPDKLLAQHMAVLGKTGSGKTVTSKGIAELLMTKGRRICAIDPTGVWWGLKSLKGGKKEGFPVVIFGGDHADFPLDAQHGATIAEIVASTDASIIVDVSNMRTGPRTRFFTEFAETLYLKNRAPLNLIIDEADLFAPQGKVASPQSAEMLHATNNLLARGRSKGLSITLITQRPAKLHKDSLTQAESLIAMRLIAPQDVNAVKEWIAYVADASKSGEVLSSLSGLTTGTGWIYAPELKILKKVQFPMIETFDSSSAPLGEQAKVKLASVDMKAIEGKLAETKTNIFSDDPKFLKRKIAELESQLRQTPKADPDALRSARKEAFEEGRNAGTREGFTEGVIAGRNEVMELFLDATAQFRDEKQLTAYRKQTEQKISQMKPTKIIFEKSPVMAMTNKGLKPVPENIGTLGKCEQAIINVLGQFDSRTKNQIALLSGYSNKSGGFNNSMSKLRSAGLIEGSGAIKATTAGKALAVYEELPRGQRLLDFWVRKLGKCEGAILTCLYNTHGSLDKSTLGEQTGYSPSSGGFNNSLSKLRTLELIEGRGEITISGDFSQ